SSHFYASRRSPFTQRPWKGIPSSSPLPGFAEERGDRLKPVILLAARQPLPLSFSKRRGDAGMIHFNCHACGRGLKAKKSQAGKSIQCSHCFASVTVPSTNGPECGRPRRTTLLGRLLQCPCQ